MSEFFTKDLFVTALAIILGTAIAVIGLRRFNVRAIAHAISDFPEDARSWTTLYNFYFCATLYIATALLVYVVLIGIPDLTTASAGTFLPGEWSESVKKFVKNATDRKEADWGRVVLAFVALLALFGFSKSPLAFVERESRELLQRWASIPTKVTATVGQLKTAEFALDSERKKLVLEHLANKLSENVRAELKDGIENTSFEKLLLQAGSLDYTFTNWSSSGSVFATLYETNEKHLQDLTDEFASILQQVETYVVGGRGRLSAEEKLDQEKRATVIDEKLTKLLNKQLFPFSCAILQSARTSEGRREHLKRFGYQVVEPPTPEQVFSALREDLASLVFFLMLVVYPLTCLFAKVFLKWKPDNGYFDLLVVWPAQLAAFALAAVLPALIILQKLASTEQSSKTSSTTSRWHFLGYLVIGIVGGISGIIAIALLGTIGKAIADASVFGAIGTLPSKLAGAASFGLVAAAIGILTAVFIDVGWLVRGWFLVEGFLTACVATVLAVVAVVARLNVDIDDFGDVLAVFTFVPEFYARHEELRVLKFVIPMVFAMGFCIGILIPRAHRRYRSELLPSAAVIQMRPRRRAA